MAAAHADDINSKSVVVACYRDDTTPYAALARLRSVGIHSSASLHHVGDNRFSVRNYFGVRVVCGFVGAVLMLLVLLVSQIHSVRYDFTIPRLVAHHPWITLVSALLGAFLGVQGIVAIGFGVRKSLLKRLKEWVTTGETFVVANVRIRDIQVALNSSVKIRRIFRQFSSSTETRCRSSGWRRVRRPSTM